MNEMTAAAAIPAQRTGFAVRCSGGSCPSSQTAAIQVNPTPILVLNSATRSIMTIGVVSVQIKTQVRSSRVNPKTFHHQRISELLTLRKQLL